MPPPLPLKNHGCHEPLLDKSMLYIQLDLPCV